MRAVIISIGYAKDMDILMQHQPTPLLTICDKPIIDYIIEKLCSLGVRQIDIVVYHMPVKIEEHLLTGRRWGVQVTYHVAKDPLLPLHILKPAIHTWKEEIIFFTQGDILPNLEDEIFKNKAFQNPLLISYYNDAWSGWAILSSKLLSNLPNDGDIQKHFNNQSIVYDTVETTPLLSTRSFEELHRSNISAINLKTSLIFPSSASEVEPKIWISRGVSILPNVEVIPPVFIGTETQINEGATIGPNAVIESYCVIGEHSTIENSIVRKKSYIGGDLNINHCIIDCNVLINIKLNSEIVIKDDFILSELFSYKFDRAIISFFERVIATLLFLILAPFYFWLKIFYTVDSVQMLQLPSSLDPSEWKTFGWYSVREYQDGNRTAFLRFSKNIPNIINIINGYIHFVGSSPRTPEATLKLPDDWKKLYLSSKIGLITLYDLESHEDFSLEHNYASEVYYAVHMGWFYDLKLIFKWVKKKFVNLWIFIFKR